MHCGRAGKELVFAEDGYSAVVTQGYTWDGFSPPVYFCRAGNEELKIELTVPKNATGKIRIYVIDADNFKGGRSEELWIGTKLAGKIEQFQQGSGSNKR